MVTEALLRSAQYVNDLYFQDFAPEDAFFTVEDFAHWIGVIYDKDIDDIARLQYANSLSEIGSGQITFSGDFLKSKELPVKKEGTDLFIEIDFKFAAFTYDSQYSGIQDVVLAGRKGKCGEFIRTTPQELWKIKLTGTSNIVWWYVFGNNIELQLSGNCNPQKVTVMYVPTSEDENFSLPKSREFDIATRAWALMVQAKQGVVVDSSNNGNKNAIMETEIDKSQLRNI